MRVFIRFLEWLDTFGGAIAMTGHVVYVHDECPHCDARTLCEISAVHRHYRCLECGRSIHDREASSEPSRRVEEKPLVPA